MTGIVWDDFKVVYEVACSESLVGAGKRLNLSHTTIIRRIERLELKLGTRIFIRHQRGYRLTEAGKILLDDIPRISEYFAELQKKLAGFDTAPQGQILISIAPEYAYLFHHVIVSFQNIYPSITVTMETSDQKRNLSDGVYHLAIRAGAQPTDADVIARPIFDIHLGYYCSDEYLKRVGLPLEEAFFEQHQWVFPNGPQKSLPYIANMRQRVASRVSYESNNLLDIEHAIVSGLGIGMIDARIAEKYAGLRRVTAIEMNRDYKLWYVYHKDMKTSRKIKLFIDEVESNYA